MTTKASYTDQEWKQLMDAPMLAGMGISMLDFGLVSFAKEFTALIRAVVQGKDKYPSNELVQSLAAEMEKRGDAEPPAAEGDQKKSADQILAELQAVASLVDRKAPADEAAGFKTFLFGISEAVAGASGSGFLGFGEKISDKEREYLVKLKSTLSVS